jgi:RNA-directed DNA polymerase
VEPRAGAEGNAVQQSTFLTQGRADASQALERIPHAARRNEKEKFTALLHHLTVERLEEAFRATAKDAAAGVDGVTWEKYVADLDRSLARLHARVHSGWYRATPSRRVYIPKPDGGRRPMAVAALEDKIVQRAVVGVLNAIYKEDLLGFPGGGGVDHVVVIGRDLLMQSVRGVGEKVAVLIYGAALDRRFWPQRG